MVKRYRFRRIKAIELLNITPTSYKCFYYLKLFAGDTKLKETGTFGLEKKVLGRATIPRWTIDLDL
ncbi:hypothetical protein ARMSODRAFT_960647 [Armillaria solidipes]|uniref:Uncharacterized protein n=1 Tax=Armillaria solidipes TaxID=1076256 RepID=A0A2H3BGM2_9AGAR|nr:hypothetical protein ARMSODRAFT_960647 [Armillaria solidipes]